MKSYLYAIAASFFFAFTFVLNRMANISGGYFLYSASLRYLFMLPILALIVWKNNGIKDVIVVIKKNPVQWILYSFIGFVLFYLPLTMSSIYGPSWLVASAWQLTIPAGIALTPLFNKKLPLKNFLFSLLIVLGVAIMQIPMMKQGNSANLVAFFTCILIAAFAYPYGNRKIMSLTPNSMTTIQRVFAMTLCSTPFWIAISILAFIQKGAPSVTQLSQSLLVAIFSGVIATTLFFKACDLAKNDMKHLAFIEATQSLEVIFALLGEMILLQDTTIGIYGYVGIAIVVVGMILSVKK